MAKAPAFQWYPKDCDTDEDVRAMDDREFGFYMRCLNHSWTNNGLPSDPAELARVIGRTQNYVRKVWVRVGKKFVEQDGRLVNLKQETQRSNAREFSESRRSAAQTRWGKEHEQSTSNAHASDMHCSALKQDADEDAGYKECSIPITPPKPKYAMDEGFMMLMAEVEKTGTAVIDADFNDAYAEWLLLGNDEKAKAVSNFREKREAGIFSDPAMVMRPVRWLKRKEFNRLLVKPAQGRTPVPAQSPLVEAAKQYHREQEARKNANL